MAQCFFGAICGLGPITSLTSLAVSNVDQYLELADRANTRRSYAASVRHYELEWRGALPATPDAIAQYLAHYAPSLTTSTLQVRLAGLSRWHRDHGFVDPTKAPIVQQVLKGVRAAHNAPRRQARPVEFDVLKRVSDWLDEEIIAAGPLAGARADLLRRSRDQAMLRLGFWRGFRSDELCRLQFEHVQVDPGVGMTCFIPRTKSDRAVLGQTFECPALSRLCPVEAFLAWQSASGLTTGPVFRRVDRWGGIGRSALAQGSVVPWLRALFREAGVQDASLYTSHSLRRGFANWARDSGWDLKALMDYVGWRDSNSALRYLDNDRSRLAQRFEQGLAQSERAQPTEPGAGAPATSPRRNSNVVPMPRRRS
jgi:integrase